MGQRLKKSAFFRKGSASLQRVPRMIERMRATPTDYAKHPPVLVNSLPKSGTHLLMQIARALPNARYFGSFVSQRPSWSTRFRSQTEIDTHLKRIIPGEVVGAHLFFSEATALSIARLNALHIFIHRDPRAVIVSEAHYLSNMAKWNALHKRFARVEGHEAQIDLAIHGDGSLELPTAAERYGVYMGWKEDPGTVAIRYEDLMNPQARAAALDMLISRYADLAGLAEAGLTREALEAAIEPEKSHTFTGSDPERWRSLLTDTQKAAIEAQFVRLS